ncbi:cupin domain-containing protein [bacterium]|nr:cupin domain-containing protein [bacterium]
MKSVRYWLRRPAKALTRLGRLIRPTPTAVQFSVIDLGSMAELERFSFLHPLVPEPLTGKKFLRDDLGLTGMEVSLHRLPPGFSVPFYHCHKQNEEFYLFLSGEGDMQVDGQVIPIREGTAIRIAPEGVRTWRNTSAGPMLYIVVQARAGTLRHSDIRDGKAVRRPVAWP